MFFLMQNYWEVSKSKEQFTDKRVMQTGRRPVGLHISLYCHNFSVVTAPLSGWSCPFSGSGADFAPGTHLSVAKPQSETQALGWGTELGHSFIIHFSNSLSVIISSYFIFIRRHQKLKPLIVTSKYSCLGLFYSPADWKRPVRDLGGCKSYGLTAGRTDQEEYLCSRTKNYQAAGSQHGSASLLCWVVLVSAILI